MKIDHAAVVVGDLEGVRHFSENYFGGTGGALYHNPRTGLNAYFLTFDSGARLEIMTLPGVTADTDSPGLGWNHLAFRVGSKAAVDSLTGRLRGDGFTVLSGPRTSGSGDYVSVVLDPEGNHVELIA